MNVNSLKPTTETETPVARPALRFAAYRLQVGDCVRIAGNTFRITDVSPRGLVLKPMSGKLEHSVQRGWRVVARDQS